MKEFALIFRLNDMADFRPSPEQMQERMNWLGSIAAQNKLADSNYYHALLGYPWFRLYRLQRSSYCITVFLEPVFYYQILF
jgi:hypothetical protein